MPPRRGRQPRRLHSERAEDRAEELGVDLDSIEGTGSRGRVTVRDVEDAAQQAPGEELDAQPEAAEDAAGTDGESVETVPPSSYGRWTHELNRYARHLEGAGADTLAKVIRDFATRVEGVREGRLPASAAVVPAGIDPGMVGKTLAAGSARRTFEFLVEGARNILIFLPVLITWWKIQGSGVNDLGDMRGTALAVVILIVVLIGMHVLLGILRQHRASRADRMSRDFAAALTNASMEASVQQAETTEAAIAAFAQAGRELTESLQGAGESLAGTRDVMERMADVVYRQGQQVEGLVELLRPISQIGNQLGAAQRELSTAAVTMSTTARTLSEIEKNIAPTAGKLDETVQELGSLTRQLDRTGKHLQRMADMFPEGVGSTERSAEQFEQAVSQLNLVSNRVAEALEALHERDGARRRVGG